MKRTLRIVPIALTISLTACAGLLGGGGKQPAYLVTLTSDIAAAYVSNNPVVAEEVGPLIEAIHGALGVLG